MEKNKTISVITPCLNLYKNKRIEYFDKMMRGIHQQTWNNLEHIIIDGASTDGTLDLLHKYQKRGWISCLVSEKDDGIYSAMNKGVSLSKGAFINIMNTDDYFIDKKYFKKCMAVLRDNNIDFTHADRLIKSRKNRPDYIKRGDGRVAFFRMPFRHQTMVVRKTVFDEIGPFDETYKIAADYKFVLKTLLADKKGHHFSQTVLYSLDGGISSNRRKCVKEVSQVLYECYGKKSSLTLNNCRSIYMGKVSPSLYSKILLNIKDKKIIKSLTYQYRLLSK